MSLEESQTAQTLLAAFSASPALLDSIQVFIWDNSPEPLLAQEIPAPFRYHHSGANVGLSRAYNSAATMAEKESIPWLLLLDQDTTLPENFLADMLVNATQLMRVPEIAAIVPTVFVKDFVVSPRRMLFNRHEAYPSGESGVADGELAAINSGSLLRVQDLLEIGGYSDGFWLDYSDWYVFHQLFLKRKLTWRATEVRLEHSMTVMDYDNLMSPWRYENFMVAEGAFNDLYKSGIENCVQTARLLVRACKQRLRFKNSEFSRITWKHFGKRLIYGRARRIERWRRDTAVRLGKETRYSSTRDVFGHQ
jgi:hypothetical protein